MSLDDASWDYMPLLSVMHANRGIFLIRERPDRHARVYGTPEYGALRNADTRGRVWWYGTKYA